MRCLVNKIFLVLLTIFVFQVSAHAADKIRIGYPAQCGIISRFHWRRRKASLRREGYRSRDDFDERHSTKAALNNGEIDYLTGIAQWRPSGRSGLPGQGRSVLSAAAFPLWLARPEIKSVKELKGKTITVGDIGSAPLVMLQLIAKHFGLDPDKDIKFLAVGLNEARLAALKQGLVAATVAPPPLGFPCEEAGLSCHRQELRTFQLSSARSHSQ